ncbi:PRTRC system protein B [Chitinophaga eiseniae]|uniref:PRTRC system protein B n=2 Tax=Chitinophaga eiseniae TaxID=634771 RepID=A0A1T4SYZ3_9BACT|nr:PRTRC system protein B [Chitinophaga eiseniae]
MDIANQYGTLFCPVSALVVFEGRNNGETYVEHYDMDKDGNPVNAHPLTVREASALAKALDTSCQASKAFLKSAGIIPQTVLHIDPSEKGGVIWFTPPGERSMYFSDRLGIPNGKAQVPALVWKASKTSLALYALATSKRPNVGTALYFAPFFNIYRDGNVCMGTVDINIKSSASLEAFTNAWESYFFNSYFSHLISNHNPIKGNCVQLWRRLLQHPEPFPKNVLIKTTKTLKALLQ